MDRETGNEPTIQEVGKKGLDFDQLYSGGSCDRLTSDWTDAWSTFSVVLNRLEMQCSAWACFVVV